MSTTERIVVTGANSGIGRAIALHLAQVGYAVVGTVRSMSKADRLLAAAEELGVTVDLVELDIADDESVRGGFDSIAERWGDVHHLVNNAGIGGNGVVEESSPQRLAEVFNVDTIGAVRCIQAVLPQMRTRGAGTIINVTSVAGRMAAIAQAPYVAAKWALEGLSEELAQEVAAFGIRVAVVEPGVTRSSIFGKNVDLPHETGAYDAQYERMLQMYAAGHSRATDARAVAEVVQVAIETDEPRLRYPISWGAVEIIGARASMSDEAWVEIGKIDNIDDYVAAFGDLFGLDISTD